MKMILDRIGLGNAVTFISTYAANKINLIDLNTLIVRITEHPLIQNWMDIMFIVSATGSALYIILKIIKFIKNWDKNPLKNN